MITNSYEVVEDNFEVVEEFGPFVLKFGEAFTPINLTEMGEIESIELVTDNPYASLYLELDDFRPYSRGVTASELINRGKDKPNNRNFYAEDRVGNGDYVIKYSPKKKEPYDSKIKIEVRNDITPSRDFMFQPNFEYRSKGDLPNPTTLAFAAGSIRNISKDGAGLKTEDFTAGVGIAPKSFDSYDHFTGVEDYRMNITNDLLRKDPLKKVGYMHPYVGKASQIEHQTGAKDLQDLDAASDGGISMVASFAEPGFLQGVDGAGNSISGLTGYTSVVPNSTPWPGDPVSGTYSQQAIFLYASESKDITEGFAPAVQMQSLIPLLFGQERTGKGNAIYFKNGNTVYYPGRIKQIAYYIDDGSSGSHPKFVSTVGELGVGGSGGSATNKGVIIIVEPGLNFAPKDIEFHEFPSKILSDTSTVSDQSEVADFGIVGGLQITDGESQGSYQTNTELDESNGTPKGLIVKKLTIKRRRKVSVI